MVETGIKNPKADISHFGFSNTRVFWNLTPEELIEHTIKKELGVIADTGALALDTGEFTGRSPKDRFIVKDATTENTVDWNNINIPFDSEKFDALTEKMVTYMEGKDLYVKDVSACAAEEYKLNIRVMTEYPWSNMFAGNMFLRLSKEEIKTTEPDWHILCVPSFKADAAIDGTRQHNFAVINFTKKMIIIGGTAYTGEIKKGIFSVLNYLLPHEKGVLSMHCSANVGKNGDTALFFGLSGTGKTTLSADANRKLIGDDEHGWSNNKVFNFEGGCYAKCIDLTAEKEPEIFAAIKHGAILENINFYEGTRNVDFLDASKTENTRVSYPIHHIDNIMAPSLGGIPKNIFFLSYDAFGVLPPISRLTESQAMYLFISGYTSKVAGTEAGITTPQTTFSACFGAAFLPLHPTQYAEMLGNKLKESGAKVWLINTGLNGEGKRMSLKYTRALITAALNGELDSVAFNTTPVFKFQIPTHCSGVPSEVLDPANSWASRQAFSDKATELGQLFRKNFTKYEAKASAHILEAQPLG